MIGLAIRYVPEIGELDMNVLEQRQQAYTHLENVLGRLVSHELEHFDQVQRGWPPPGPAAEATAITGEHKKKQLPSPFKVLEPNLAEMAKSYPEAFNKDGQADYNKIWRLALARDREKCAIQPGD
jgi:hypothetical protein